MNAPTPQVSADLLGDALARIAEQTARIAAEFEAIAAESRACVARLEALDHVNPLAHLIGAWNV